MKYGESLKILKVEEEQNRSKPIRMTIIYGNEILGKIELYTDEAYKLGLRLQLLAAEHIEFGS